ncbi:MAG: hypothetical protein ABW189_02130 [Rickettsiales bacterium]
MTPHHHRENDLLGRAHSFYLHKKGDSIDGFHHNGNDSSESSGAGGSDSSAYYKKLSSYYSDFLDCYVKIYNFLRSRGILKHKVRAAEIMNEKEEQSQDADRGMGD